MQPQSFKEASTYMHPMWPKANITLSQCSLAELLEDLKGELVWFKRENIWARSYPLNVLWKMLIIISVFFTALMGDSGGAEQLMEQCWPLIRHLSGKCEYMWVAFFWCCPIILQEGWGLVFFILRYVSKGEGKVEGRIQDAIDPNIFSKDLPAFWKFKVTV